MLKQAYRQGIQAVVIAPHYSYQFMEEQPENFGKTEVKSTADYGGKHIHINWGYAQCSLIFGVPGGERKGKSGRTN